MEMLHAKLTEVLSSNRTFMELKLLGIAAFVAVMFVGGFLFGGEVM